MNDDYRYVEAAIGFITEHAKEQPSLDEIALRVGLSPQRCRNVFRRWAGITPKRFLQYLTVAHAKHLLDESCSVLEAALQAGLSGPSRLHDHFVALEALTPGEYKLGGLGMTIGYGIEPTPFGAALIAVSPRGICGLAFLDADEAGPALERLRGQWPNATLVEDPRAAATAAQRIFAPTPDPQKPLHVLVRGTNFQVRVWEALLRIPEGALGTYSGIAAAAGNPGAARAAGSAIGANPIAWLIPCHRVVRANGLPGGYRWGTTRKRAILAWEAARHGQPDSGPQVLSQNS